jgi:signal transduction histidine kinase
MKLPASDKRTLVGHRLAVLTIIGFWIFHFIVVSLRSALLNFPSVTELAQRRLFVTLIGIFLTWLLYLILRNFDRRPLGQRVATACFLAIPCAFSIAYVNFYVFNIYDPAGIFVDLDPNSGPKDLAEQLGMTAWQEVSEIAITRYFFIIAWAALYLALGYAQEVREAERTTSRYAQAAQEAELRSLRYQVNPHFLFNTLNSLSSLVITGRNAAAEAMIQNISSFYRSSLSLDPLEDVALDEELALQKRYLEIETVRYPDRLKTRFDIESGVGNTKIPAMILQPLVENAIKYGVGRTNRPVTVEISAKRQAGNIVIAVSDDGESAQNVATTRSTGAGIGLSNVKDRLEARYAKRARLETGPGKHGGFAAKIILHVEQVNGE